MAKKNTPKPLFPIEYMPEKQEGGIVVWITGDKESGKSTAAAGADPVRPGRPSNTFYVDLEGSTATLRSHYSLEVYDTLQDEGDELFPDVKFKGKRLFLAYQRLIERIKAGEEPRAKGKRTFVLDTMDALWMGTNAWVKERPSDFGYHEFRGEMGHRTSFGPTREWWEDHAKDMAKYFDLVILISHIGDDWKDNKRVGLRIKGPDIGRTASFGCWMHKPSANETEPGIEPGTRWVEVRKDRFTWVYWPTLDDLREDGILDDLVTRGVLSEDELDTLDEDDGRLQEYLAEQPRPVLPRKFPVPVGKTVFGIIRSYMRNPQRSYGALDQIHNPGNEFALTDDDRLQLKAAMAQAEADAAATAQEKEITDDKVRLVKALKRAGVPNAAFKVRDWLDERGLGYSLDLHDEIRDEILKAHAEDKDEGEAQV